MDVTISASTDIYIGQSFKVVAKVTNTSSSDHTYKVKVRGRAMLYTGITGQVVKAVSEGLSVPAGQGQ